MTCSIDGSRFQVPGLYECMDFGALILLDADYCGMRRFNALYGADGQLYVLLRGAVVPLVSITLRGFTVVKSSRFRLLRSELFRVRLCVDVLLRWYPAPVTPEVFSQLARLFGVDCQAVEKRYRRSPKVN